MDTADPILIEDLDGRVQDMNLEAERAYGWSRVELLGRPIRTIVPEERHGVEPGGAQVLVVEDHASTRLLVRRMLEKEGCRVVEAENGREGLERMKQLRPDLILLDLMMPVMDGFEFASELRRTPNWRDVPIIVTTAKDLTPEDHEALSGVVEAVLQKNASSLDDLMQQVRGALAPENGTTSR